LFPDLQREPILSIDTETTGLHWYEDEIFSISIAIPGRSWYWDIRDTPGVLNWLRDNARLWTGRIVNHNIKFDYHFLREKGIVLPEDRIECTLVRAALINEHEREYDLDSIGRKCVGVGKSDEELYHKLAAMFGGNPTRHAQMKNISRAPVSIVEEYGKQDAVTALALWEWQEKEIDRQELRQIWDLERQLTPVLIRMEKRGVPVDVDRAERVSIQLKEVIKRLQRELDDLTGIRGFNVNSTPQIRNYFKPRKNQATGHWELPDGTRLETTDGGHPSIGADALRASSIPAAKKILEIRKLIKTVGTFLEGHILGHAKTGVVHPNYNQTKSDNGLGVGPGRLSVNDPALQQIPSRDEGAASIVRACFIGGDREWISSDWDQFEFRWFAHYANNEDINKRYEENPETDFHGAVAEITGLPRSPRFAGDPNAKQINLGLVFGMGEGTMAMEMGMSYETEMKNGREYRIAGEVAKGIFARYHAAVPGVRELLQRAGSIAKSRGYVRTVGGRHIRFPGGLFTHKAGGLIFQGSSADCMKLKLIELERELAGTGADVVLSVHDEVDVLAPSGDVTVQQKIKEVMERFDGGVTPIRCNIPIRASIGVGPNWYEASK
jgi:DNA polymerase-1